MSKYKKFIQKTLTTRQQVVAAFFVLTFAVGGVIMPLAQADEFEAQINALKQQNSGHQESLDQLGAQASSLGDQIGKLQAQINALEDQIRANQAKSDDIQAQIVKAQAELEKQKKLLGENIRQMYLEGEISTLEMLASSKDLSDFVDKQQYRDAVQSKIKTTLDKITALKLQLKSQKQEVEDLLRDEKNMQGQIVAQQGEQQRLLALNQQEQSAVDQQIKANNTKVSELRAQQAAANAKLGGRAVAGDPGHGGYPAYLDNAAQDSLVDPWGMYNRECVSYTAWKVYQTYGRMPYWGGHGNANQWPANARADGIPTGSTPRVGSVAVSMAGFYGHVMWVEAVAGDKIYVSQYNYDLAGHYSEMWISASNLTFIYFN